MPGIEEWGEISDIVMDNRGYVQFSNEEKLERFETDLKTSINRLGSVNDMIEMIEEQEILQQNLDILQKMAEFGVTNMDNYPLGDRCLIANVVSTYALESERVREQVVSIIENHPEIKYRDWKLKSFSSVRQIIDKKIFPYLRDSEVIDIREIGPQSPFLFKIVCEDQSTFVVLISSFQVKPGGILEEYINTYNDRFKRV